MACLDGGLASSGSTTARSSGDGRAGLVIRRLPPPIWETVPALVVPAPMFVLSERAGLPSFTPPEFAYTLLTIDLDYVKNELLPMLAQRHFRKVG